MQTYYHQWQHKLENISNNEQIEPTPNTHKNETLHVAVGVHQHQNPLNRRLP